MEISENTVEIKWLNLQDYEVLMEVNGIIGKVYRPAALKAINIL